MGWYRTLMAKIWFWYVWRFSAIKPPPEDEKDRGW